MTTVCVRKIKLIKYIQTDSFKIKSSSQYQNINIISSQLKEYIFYIMNAYEVYIIIKYIYNK